MIIEALMGLVTWIIRAILIPVDIQSLPETFATVLLIFTDKMIRAATIIGTYIHGAYIVALLTFVVAFESAIVVYHVVLWILKKIPFLNIK